MPVEVDGAARRRQIGDAGLRVVRASGVAALTMRAVATELGGSTSLVTNYVRNRVELLDLTINSALRQWDTEAEELSAATGGGLSELAAWAVDWYSGDGPIVASVLLEVLAAQPDADRLAAVRRELDLLHRQLRDAAAADTADDPERSADLLYLITRGAMITSVEDPQRWPVERLTAAATYLVDRLRPAQATAEDAE